MPSCFLITPIGNEGTETRECADALLEELRTALAPYGFEVTRGDHHISEARIDIDVVRSVQEADICVADLSDQNPNVYYEVGRRAETGKPIIYVKRQDSAPLPTDIATTRCQEYELETRKGAADFRKYIQSAAEPFIKNGFDSGQVATLSDVAQLVQKVERKVDSLKKELDEIKKGTKAASAVAPRVDHESAEGLSARDQFRVGMRSGDVAILERALERLRLEVDDDIRYYDFFVSEAASRGVKKAGNMTIDFAWTFFDDPKTTPRMKSDYLVNLIIFLTRSDREMEQLQLVEDLAADFFESAGEEDAELKARVYNQLNRLYFGIYQEGGREDETMAQKAIEQLRKALELRDDPVYHHNIAVVLETMGKPEEALPETILALKAEAENPSEEHLRFACELFKELGDPRYEQTKEILCAMNPNMRYLV